jgi:hypothetical protein
MLCLDGDILRREVLVPGVGLLPVCVWRGQRKDLAVGWDAVVD